ncbi:coil containing protein [Vibrio phage 1.107.A._10N.286.52.E10]|uniref:Coil containing protein n=3 Tax=unclassified Autolykiviridae TaxID=2788751 RepID=A0A2I7R332_9VIRU|nr:coil containing protein [Vibrio phage 1.107.A._10N.286.52.E10]AUR88040.1 coil containing protein [Vibrio phage 1.107.B._10N.286.52.E10]AUR88062.1 coil containing protein [Vibrio phage 1.107.C._10N.286.52.E10]
MSFSKGGSSKSATTNEQNPITATDSAIVAAEGSTVNITDGGAFDVVRDIIGSNESVVNDVILINERISDTSINAGLDYFGQANASIQDSIDKVFDFANETVSQSQDTIASSAQAIFDSAKSDELNKSQDLNATIRELSKWAVFGVVGYTALRYAFK